MDFEFWPAALAGLAGGLVMSALMALMRKTGETEMDMALIEGSMFTGNRGTAKVIGLMMHLVVMSALVIGCIYALLYTWLDVDSRNAWWVGALIGTAHGLIGGVVMAILPAVHPRMHADATAGGQSGSPVVLKPPGLFAKNYGNATPPGVLISHIAYGMSAGAVYGWLVS